MGKGDDGSCCIVGTRRTNPSFIYPATRSSPCGGPSAAFIMGFGDTG